MLTTEGAVLTVFVYASAWQWVERCQRDTPLTLTLSLPAAAVRPQSNRTGLQLLMFFVSTACGSSFLYVYARSGFEVVVRQVAPLGTLWLYSLVRLDLSGVLLSLSLIWAFVAYHDLPVLS